MTLNPAGRKLQRKGCPHLSLNSLYTHTAYIDTELHLL